MTACFGSSQAMCHARLWILLSSSVPIVFGQPARDTGYTQSLKAEVVLTPAFCRTEIEKGSFFSGHESFAVGREACRQMEQHLKYAFASVGRVETEPPPESTTAQVVLIPKFVDLNATRPAWPVPAAAEREVVILLEWTAKTPAGKLVWIETVQGSARRRSGMIPTRGRRRIVEDAIRALLQASARKMSDAPELRNLMRAKTAQQ